MYECFYYFLKYLTFFSMIFIVFGKYIPKNLRIVSLAALVLSQIGFFAVTIFRNAYLLVFTGESIRTIGSLLPVSENFYLEGIALSIAIATIFGMSENILADGKIVNLKDRLPLLLFFPFMGIWPIRLLPIGGKYILLIFNLLLVYYIIINTIYLRRIKNVFQEKNQQT